MIKQSTEEVNELEQKILNLKQFKLITQDITEHIEALENSIEHAKFISSADVLPFSPKIYIHSITARERNLLFQCGKGVDADDAILSIYNRKNFKSDKLKLKLTEKACVDVEFFDQLATTCYQYMLKNIDLLSIEKTPSGF